MTDAADDGGQITRSESSAASDRNMESKTVCLA